MEEPNLNRLGECLEWLASRGRLSGSYARGTYHGESDVDVRLAERQVKVLKRMLMQQRVKWDSPFLGSITWWPDGVQVEVSYLFPRYKPLNRSVELFGVVMFT